ncbi:MAG: preprotein translocase subunit SecE [Anaerolineae bacterium]|jgi:preprotein translocase subunit SecE|nr:preprotein translocase subunit SecE [Anaerolineae bacterium]
MSADVNNQRRRTEAEIEADEAEMIEDDDEELDAPTGAVTAKKGRATEGRRNRVEEETSGNLFTRIRDYFLGVQSEVGKVAWPQRQEALRLTGIILVVIVLASLILGGLSLGFNLLFGVGIRTPLIFVLFFIISGALFVFLRNRLFQPVVDETAGRGLTSSRF